jgi:hypothetical protein
MKLASLKDGRDGRLVVVSRDLSRCVAGPDIAATLQQAIERWEEVAPGLHKVADELNVGRHGESFPAAWSRPCRARISGSMARPMSPMSNWCAEPAVSTCRRPSGVLSQ